MENKHKHLEFIQGVISRMAQNSFILKGWGVTLAVALFAFATKDVNAKYVVIAFIPILIFWLLDSYYLQKERLFRLLYDEVREKNENQIDFSMHINHLKKNNPWVKSFLSGTLLVVYIPLLVFLIATVKLFVKL